ncbi:MAG: tripartite motif-containing protein 71, partial [Patescibacteria group bacterium]|nr:tripartite motif-containing protein 71 [Patescibacteria group bacterium]
SGNIYVIELNNTRVQKFDSSGNYISQFGSFGSGDGQFDAPYDISIDSSDYIYTIDGANNRVQKFDSSGNYVSQFGSSGSGDGEFGSPRGIFIDSSGDIFVSDTSNNRIQKFDSSGNYISQFGISGSGDGEFGDPYGLFVDSQDNIYISDSGNGRIQKINLNFDLQVSSLQCGTTYNYRTYATTVDGIGYGEDQQFTTSSCGSSGGGGSNPTPVPGCTDSDADNYNASATQDNGSCLYIPGAIPGCTDLTAGNYNSTATVDNGSCLYGVFGCMDSAATNYNPLAVYSSACTYLPPPPIDPPSDDPDDVNGCMDPGALNYNPTATVNSVPCDYLVPLVNGCTDISADNFNSSATVDDGSCEYSDIPSGEPSGGGGGHTIINSVTGFIKENPGATLVISGLGLIVPSVETFLSPGVLASLLSIPIRIWNIIPTLLGFRRRKRPWGTVYDSVTKQPLDPVYVMLKNISGKEISTSITDLDGRYGFQVEEGQYSIFANKANYIFPSVKLAGKTEDELYNNLYFGGSLEVSKNDEIINKNIPMDSLSFNWNEFEKTKNKKLMKFYSEAELFLARISKILFFAGLISSVVLTALDPRTFNLVILGLYALIIVLALFGIKPRASGYVKEKETGFPLSFGVISVFSAELGREVAHTVIGKTGRYYLLVPKGKYFIKLKKKTGEDSYEEIYESESFSVKKGYINKVIKI